MKYFVAFAFCGFNEEMLAASEKLRFRIRREFWRAELLVGSSAAILWPGLRLGKAPRKKEETKICLRSRMKFSICPVNCAFPNLLKLLRNAIRVAHLDFWAIFETGLRFSLRGEDPDSCCVLHWLE